MSGLETPRTWEYLTVRSDAVDDLNELGRQGWEMAGVSGTAVPMLYFKRPAADFRTRVTLDQKRRAFADAGRQFTEQAE